MSCSTCSLVVSTAGRQWEQLHDAVVFAFRTMHEQIRELDTDSGSTVTVCCVNATRAEVSAWNAGDSLVVLIDWGGHVMFSQSHRLEENPEEQARITALGARLGRARNSRGTEAGPACMPGGLAVTAGDADCGSIVTPEPSYSRCHALPSGGAIVAAQMACGTS